jgi:hypothetical protein
MRHTNEQPDDAEELFRETLDELDAEAQIVPPVLLLPRRVIEAIEAYEKAHSVDRQHMFWTACNAREEWTHQLAKLVAQLIEDPSSFEWPVHDPLLCVSIGYLRKAVYRWVEKMQEKHDLGDDEDDSADWWKAEGS